MGESLYSNLSESDLKAIVSATVAHCISSINESVVNKACDEWEVETLLKASLASLQSELVIPSRKTKLTP